MIVKRGLALVATAGAVAACAGVVVISAGYALYALLEPMVGKAGASALVALAAAVLMAIVALVGARIAFPNAGPRPARAAAPPQSNAAKALEFVKARPIAGGVAIVVAGIAGSIFMVRNPLLATAVLKSFFDTPRNPPHR